MHGFDPVAVGAVSIFRQPNRPHLLPNCEAEEVPHLGQLGQCFPSLVAPPQLGHSSINFRRRVIQASPGNQNAMPRHATARRGPLPLHDCPHLTAKARFQPNQAALLAPVAHQLANQPQTLGRINKLCHINPVLRDTQKESQFLIHHRPTPKISTQHTIPQPDTYPTQIKPNEINSLNKYVLSVLGLLGLFVLA